MRQRWNVLGGYAGWSLAVGRPCTICIHAERVQIDREIIAGLPYRDISGRFEVSKSAVERHAGEHLAAAIARVADLAAVDAKQLIGEIRALRETTFGVLEEARHASDHGAALRALERLEKQTELVGRLAGELVDRQRVEHVAVVFAADWLALRPRIVAALRPFPDATAALLSALADAGS